jgi:hypothetical protein
MPVQRVISQINISNGRASAASAKTRAFPKLVDRHRRRRRRPG